MFWKKEVNFHNYSLKQEKHMQCYLFIIFYFFFCCQNKIKHCIVGVYISTLSVGNSGLYS